MFNSLAQTTTEFTTSTSTSSGGSPVVSILYLVLLVAIIVGMWKVFEKAGEKGWKSLIPFYSTWVLFEIAGKPGWWLLLALIPFVNIYAGVVLALELAKRFGKSTAFGIFGLFFFSFVGYLILGFGDAKYDGGKYKPTATPPAAAPAA